MANPVPVACYGHNAKVAEAVKEKLLPDYDGTHSRKPYHWWRGKHN
jgi:hypothetical protein